MWCHVFSYGDANVLTKKEVIFILSDFCKSIKLWSVRYGSMRCGDNNEWSFGGPDDEWSFLVPEMIDMFDFLIYTE